MEWSAKKIKRKLPQYSDACETRRCSQKTTAQCLSKSWVYMHDKLPCNCHWHTFHFVCSDVWNWKAEKYASAVSSTHATVHAIPTMTCCVMCMNVQYMLVFLSAPCRVAACHTSAVWICLRCWHIACGVGLPYLQWVVAWAIDTVMECVLLMLNLVELSPWYMCDKTLTSSCMYDMLAALWLFSYKKCKVHVGLF